jgi:hypothetical protein
MRALVEATRKPTPPDGRSSNTGGVTAEPLNARSRTAGAIA